MPRRFHRSVFGWGWRQVSSRFGEGPKLRLLPGYTAAFLPAKGASPKYIMPLHIHYNYDLFRAHIR